MDPMELQVAADLLQEKGFELAASLLRELHAYDSGGIQGTLHRIRKPDWKPELVFGDGEGLRAEHPRFELLVAMDGEQAYFGIERSDGYDEYVECGSIDEAKARAEQWFAEQAIDYLEWPLGKYLPAEKVSDDA